MMTAIPKFYLSLLALIAGFCDENKQKYLAELNGNTPLKSRMLTPEQQRFQKLETLLKRIQMDNDILKKRCLFHPR